MGVCDLDDGKDIKAVIKNVTVKRVKNTDGKEQERNVATFTDPNLKPMILNVTNCKIIKKFTKSAYITEWNNVPVQIYVKDDIRAFGDITEGLRIREVQPIMGKPKLTKNSQAWQKVVDYLKKDGSTIEKVKSKYDITKEDEDVLIQSVLV
jgi:hypothetical protein